MRKPRSKDFCVCSHQRSVHAYPAFGSGCCHSDKGVECKCKKFRLAKKVGRGRCKLCKHFWPDHWAGCPYTLYPMPADWRKAHTHFIRVTTPRKRQVKKSRRRTGRKRPLLRVRI